MSSTHMPHWHFRSEPSCINSWANNDGNRARAAAEYDAGGAGGGGERAVPLGGAHLTASGVWRAPLRQ
eukprot:822077-Prorocentrum_minimum.AAC.1